MGVGWATHSSVIPPVGVMKNVELTWWVPSPGVNGPARS